MGSNLDLLTSFKDNCGFGLLANLKNKPSHKNLEDAITSLERMMHRGAVAADGKTGDGSGLLLSMPDYFMRKVTAEKGIDLPETYAVAMIFTKDIKDIDVFKEYCENNDLKVLMTRDVPVDTNALGKQALDTLPNIIQVFVTPGSLMSSKRFDAMLYLTRKECEHHLEDKHDFYIPSFSSKVIAYKGLIMPTHIKHFYLDLRDEDFQISFSLFHQRFSTNTLPKWKLAQPFRAIAHNGEINSVEANRFSVEVKSEQIESEIFTDDELKRILPILQEGSSDSASLDNMFEFMVVNGVDFFKAARSLIPAPWQNAPHMDSDLRAFYEYTAASMEAWDGPAAVSLTDGRHIGCLIDRNGLRPSKYIITKDKNIYITSEYGTLPIEEDNILERGRLQSGQMIALDLKYGKILKEDDINDYLKSSQNYSKWLNNGMKYLQEYIEESFLEFDDYKIDELENKQKYFNVTYEVIDQVIDPMAKDGKEPVGSMGDDTPLAAFSKVNRNFTDFFRQKFAQVTNPPIDPYREKVVMSLETGFGRLQNILLEKEDYSKRLKVASPILMKEKYDVLISFGDSKSPRYDSYYKNKTFYTTFDTDLESSLKQLAKDVVESVRNEDVTVIILDDRKVSKSRKIIPMAMVVGYINNILLKEGIRHRACLVSVTGEVYDAHMAAVLLAFGVTAIYPYLMYGTIVGLYERKGISKYEMQRLLKNTLKSLNAGLLKIMSKMGISTVASYRNSGLFDIIGLSDKIVSECFEGAHSELSGLGYLDIEKRIEKSHYNAFYDNNHMFPLDLGGFYKYIDGGEYHDYGPQTTNAMHNKNASKKEDISDFDGLRKLVENRDKKFIRDFFEFKSDRKSIDISQVESKESIFKRFATAAMSCGSISPEAHEALAVAMNTIGGSSNSGEGGEDKARFNTLKNSKIKQVASGRFGVTPGYLRSAEELQIKVAQGAKPGEGGQLPGHKVTPLIATLRHTVAGVTLISPPPHHDIYSIEDLAQLIFDLKQVNPDAKITVKLVSSIGVGTIAAGVAKAYADKIIISGGDGGTGAAPLTSIKHAGNSWELGLSEAHNALKANHLREFVHVQTDGGLKTGLDIVKAAMLGAESYAFGTAALTLLGCKILRICHTNKCSVGVATQDEDLREQFNGTVERLISYFTFLAEEVREILANLGYKTIEEIVGRSDLLKVIDDEFAKKFDFQNVLRRIDGVDTCQKESNEPFDKNKFEKDILKKVYRTIEKPSLKVKVNEEICNLNRSFGALISGEIAKFYGDEGLPDETISINLKGVAGQSFGAFLSKGMVLNLEGVANDYVGKGMNGGKIIINPYNQGKDFAGIGNTCLYGATGGSLYVKATAGERFAVRNSGCTAVVEGTGDNACEYMTGGIVVILGPTGINFGAGMTGGLGFVYDDEKAFVDNMNQELIEAVRIDTDDTERERLYLKRLLVNYLNETGSEKAESILDNFRAEIRNFWMVKPKDMKVLPLDPENGD
ncbi:glutamate synthase large subunit [Malaciobacter molluscorum LMG 25693]|uniref:Glutamate synthase large subunit n=1 Tax=Malaciobacter molluscorum LMG 25693 TaxID=870501 RepID=A0A2G1DJT7_9BACT|nr:glutamate synthase large subunit [Malaciobacter molluscorum]AXX92921.1 glutamate synthase, large subunit [Malaciobacter molluscorum LMG 25693]PHO18752.1 glutamate synthase large subunit [Malaciobacter molluscorum LMG 25693]RXJ96227.1 glutamate synthase large subunit [Malaciobacter molluscorum]